MTIQFTITVEGAQTINGIEYTQAQLQQGLAQVRSAHNQRTGESLTDAEWLQWANLQNLAAWYEQGKGSEPVPPSPVTPVADWLGLTFALEPYFNIGLAANYAVFTQCFNMLVALQRTATFDHERIEWRNFAFNLNLGQAAFSAEQKGEIEAIFSTFDIPFTFDAG